MQLVRAQEVVDPVQGPERGAALDRLLVVAAVGDLHRGKDKTIYAETRKRPVIRAAVIRDRVAVARR